MSLHPKCAEIYKRSEQVLAGGPATLSKIASRYPLGLAPMILDSGEDAYVTCPDGERYLDTVAALGPILLGHADPAVTVAVMEQAAKMASGTLSTRLETEVAELLCSIIPGAERVRFASNGKDVTEAAIKLARHVTGKPAVIYTGYHGGFADYLVTTDKGGGVLPSISTFNKQIPFGDLSTTGTLCAEHGDRLAAIICEVPPRPYGEDKREVFAILAQYQDIAHRNGALFILDEVVTGFRYALGGAQEYYGIRADLACFSKGMANGYPCAALTGSADVMRAFDGGTVFLSTTFGANPVGLAACKATLAFLKSASAYADFVTYGTEAVDAAAELLAARNIPVTLRGNHARFVFDFAAIDGASVEQMRTLWMQEMCKRGVLAGVPYFPMACWRSTEVEVFANAVGGASDVLAEVVSGQCSIYDALEVPVISDVFSGRYERKN